MLVDADHPYSGQPIRSGRGDQAGGRTHRDGAGGMPRDAEFGGDRRDRGAVDHQPPQHIPGTAPRCRRSRGRQLPEILIEHRPPTRWRCAAVPRHRNPQHQRVAGHRQIRQRPDHGVAIAALATTVRTPRITGHRRAEDRRYLLIDSSVGDGHAQLDRAHDRVGNNRRRAGSSLRHGSPRRGGVSVGTRIVTRRGPTSAQRHELSAGNPHHWCTLIREEPNNGAVTLPPYSVPRSRTHAVRDPSPRRLASSNSPKRLFRSPDQGHPQGSDTHTGRRE